MKILKQLIKLHKLLFLMAILFTFLSIALNLCWNKFLARMLDFLQETSVFHSGNGISILFNFMLVGLVIVVLHILSEYLSSYFSFYTCEVFAHEMRMAYARHYLQSDIRTLSNLNVGQEQSAMQNELKDVSDYFNENLFQLMKQFGAFVFTVIFLLCQNCKLAILPIVPVIPLIIYCSFSSRIIKRYTEQCQDSRKKINGVADMVLDLFPVIQVFGAYKLIRKAMEDSLSEWERTNVEKEWVCARLMSLSGVLSFVPLLLLLGFGGIMVINGEISTGIFYIFINLSGNVSGFLQNMPGIYANFRRFGASVSRLENKLVWEEN